jgi:hypothetical protein
MGTKTLRFNLRVAGAVLLTVGGVRIAREFWHSVEVSGLGTNVAGFWMCIGLDNVGLALMLGGGLLCTLSFWAGSKQT